MSTTRLIGYKPPKGYMKWKRPVQVESAYQGLSACSLTDGRAILMWPKSDFTSVRYAIVDSMSKIKSDDVVTADMIQTALAPAGGSIIRVVVYRAGAGLFFTVLGKDAGGPSSRNTYWVRIYQANSTSNPTSWSLHSEVHPSQSYPPSTTHNYTNFGGTITAGIPLILSSGRWVMTWAAEYAQAFVSNQGWTARRARAGYSDDGGVNWTVAGTWEGGGIGSSADGIGPQVVQDPTTGYLYIMVDPGTGVGTPAVYRSTNNGSSWSTVQSSPGSAIPMVDDGTIQYWIGPDTSSGDIYTYNGSTFTYVISIWNPSGFDPPVSWSFANNENSDGNDWSVGLDPYASTIRNIVDSGKLWYFMRDRVGRYGRNWWMGEVGFN